jgi:hypothetical protein
MFSRPCWKVVVQTLLEGGGADADAPEAVQLALLDALELGDEEKGGDEE